MGRKRNKENMKKEEYEGQIVELKEDVEQYHQLLEVLYDKQVELPYRCSSCHSWMNVIEYNDFHYHDKFSVSTNTWESQLCECCPVCAKEEMFEDVAEHIETQTEILELGGQPCTECMEWYTNTMNQKIEDAIIKFSGMEGYTDDVYYALQYVSDEDLYSNPHETGWWVEREDDYKKSWCDKKEWFEIAFA